MHSARCVKRQTTNRDAPASRRQPTAQPSPDLLEAGGPELVRAQLREIDRVLRAPGNLVIMNLSYRGDLALDCSDAQAFSAELGFKLLRDGTSDLRSWDGTTFHFRKP